MSAPKLFNYLSLPRELRDQIMDYALHPGEVCIPAAKSSPQDRSRYGVQLLATCRQVYEEGHEIWYGKNTFRVQSCTASEMRQVLGAYQAKHLGMIPTLVIDCTLYDLPQSRRDSLLDMMIATADEEMIASADYWESYGFARNNFSDHFTEQLEHEWRTKIKWLRSEVPGGHRMHTSLDRSTFDRIWFDLEGTGMESGFGFLCDAIEVKMGTTITTEVDFPLMFDDIREVSPERWSGLALTQEYKECPRNRTLRDSVRICGVPSMRCMYYHTGTKT